MIRSYGESTGRQARMNEIYDRARAGEPAALAVVERAAKALGLALSHAVSLLNPKIVVLSGHLAAAEDVMVPLIRDEIARNTLPGLLQGLTIACSALGLDTRLKGAGAFAFRKSLDDPALLARMCSPVVSRAAARA
jgi:glucokinase